MAKKRDIRNELLDLIHDGSFDIVQQINGGDEEPYEGCTHNLDMILDSDEATVRELDDSDPHARKGCKTYLIEYSTIFGDIMLFIWEV